MDTRKSQHDLVKIYEGFYGGLDQQPAPQDYTPSGAPAGLSYKKGGVPTTQPGHSSPKRTMQSNEEDDNPVLSDLVEALNELILSWRGVPGSDTDSCAEELTNLLAALDL